MAKNKDHVSVWFWMFAIFVMAIPCIGAVMVLVWAFWGDNQSRKNYFRALILWFQIGVALWVALLSLGFWPEIWMNIQRQLQQLQHLLSK